MDRYNNIQDRVVEDKTVVSTTRYPYIPESEQDYYVITTTGDRFDILSFQFYGDSKYWWAIAASNPSARKDTLFLEPGLQLRIPPISTILTQFEVENSL